MDVAAYLRRIGYDGHTAPTLATLRGFGLAVDGDLGHGAKRRRRTPM